MRSRAEILRFFDGLDLVDPGGSTSPSGGRTRPLTCPATQQVLGAKSASRESPDARPAGTLPIDGLARGHDAQWAEWGWPAADEVVNLRWILVFMIGETAAHAGHLDTARELLDGRTGPAGSGPARLMQSFGRS